MMTFSLFADTTKQAIPDSTKVTMVTIYNDAKEAMKGLGAALKVGSEHVYEILVKQQLVNSIVYTIILLLGLFMFIYAYNKYKAENWKEGPGFSAIPGILGIILFLGGLSSIDVIITGFVNPEYGALKEIMELIKK